MVALVHNSRWKRLTCCVVWLDGVHDEERWRLVIALTFAREEDLATVICRT